MESNVFKIIINLEFFTKIFSWKEKIYFYYNSRESLLVWLKEKNGIICYIVKYTVNNRENLISEKNMFILDVSN